MGLELINRIEFHEGKSRNLTKPYIETRYYVSDLEKFLAYCNGDKWEGEYGQKRMFKWNVERKKKSRAKRPHFDMRVGETSAEIFPRENMVAVIQCGIHYICQHSFDILPRDDKQLFYGRFEHNRACIGMLFGLDGSKRKVFTTDILNGFMLHREDINEYDDSFVVWIQARRKNDATEKDN